MGTNMLFFCTWKDEDGRHYGITTKPKAFFNWPGCHLCDPKTAKVDAEETYYTMNLTTEDMIKLLNGEFLEVDLEGDLIWDYYRKVRENMRFLF